jgi:catechol 2,3-dioxygenase-like lactoylglutathione lyase family enzyme
MAIVLNHTIVPAHDKESSARFFAKLFGLDYEGPNGHFAPVRVNDTLTFDFDAARNFDFHHYAFHVSEEEFDAILKRVQDARLPFGCDPWSRDGTLNNRNGGRGVYFEDLNGHIFELMTRTGMSRSH